MIIQSDIITHIDYNMEHLVSDDLILVRIEKNFRWEFHSRLIIEVCYFRDLKQEKQMALSFRFSLGRLMTWSQ